MNLDILYLIAEYIEPNPVTFCRYAQVSRDFYIVFTSDTIWRYLDPYGWNKNIMKRFLIKCEPQLPLVRWYWCDWVTRSIDDFDSDNEYFDTYSKMPVPRNDNSYLWLAYYVNSADLEFCRKYTRDAWIQRQSHTVKITDWQQLWCAVHINGNALRYASDHLKTDRNLTMTAASCHGCSLSWAHPHYKSDPEFILAALRAGCFDPKNNQYPLKYLPPIPRHLLQDSDFLARVLVILEFG